MPGIGSGEEGMWEAQSPGSWGRKGLEPWTSGFLPPHLIPPHRWLAARTPSSAASLTVTPSPESPTRVSPWCIVGGEQCVHRRGVHEGYCSSLQPGIPADDAYFLQDLSLELLFPESFGFITYQGSLSTPPCSETVTWILIDRALNITSLQVTLCLPPPVRPTHSPAWASLLASPTLLPLSLPGA